MILILLYVLHSKFFSNFFSNQIITYICVGGGGEIFIRRFLSIFSHVELRMILMICLKEIDMIKLALLGKGAHLHSFSFVCRLFEIE